MLKKQEKQRDFFMIEYIKGDLTDLSPALAVVEAHGIGYGLNISLNTYSAVQGKKNIKLYVHEAIMTGGRDDNYTLYGFATKQERSLYRISSCNVGSGSKHCTNDIVVAHTSRTLQRNCQWRR